MAGLAVGFAGTPAFAATALEAIARAGYTIPLVLTRPDRPKGRGLRLEPSPVKTLALRRGLPIAQPATLKAPADREPILAVPVDVLVVAAYGLLLPPAILAWPRHGCLNIHASLLPRWRGAAPIVRAIEAGDSTGGVSIMQMDAGLDTGPVIDTVPVPIAPDDTAATLHDRIAAAGAAAIVEVLARLARDGRLDATPQPPEGATYAAKVTRADAALDWTRDATSLDRQVRAYDPVPGAHAIFGDEPVKIRAARAIARAVEADAGVVVGCDAEGIDVACGPDASSGALRLVAVQPSGGRTMPAAAFAAGRGIRRGSRFGPGPRDRDR